MSLPDDLLTQAAALIATDPERPRQADLRRAASAAYYALFHELCSRSAMLSLPSDATEALHEAFQRAHGHSLMKKACMDVAAAYEKQQEVLEGKAAFSQSQLKIQQLFKNQIPDAVWITCTSFVRLHSVRERADYSSTSTFTHEQVFFLHMAAYSTCRVVRELLPADAAALYLLLRTRDLRLG